MVARFSGTAGRLKWHTVEHISFGVNQVDFEHIGGTFRGTRERFSITRAEGGAQLEHSGSLTMPGGIFGWLGGRLFARRAFEQHVAGHMGAMAARHAAAPRD